jgi:hypothetical protein
MPERPPINVHERVRNPLLYQDRTVQDWHFNSMVRQASAIDLDLYGYCNLCYEPLYLIEASTNPDKAVNALMGLALRASVPAFLVLHRDGRIVKAHELTRTLVHEGGDALKAELALNRFTHVTRHHPEIKGLLRVLERDLP